MGGMNEQLRTPHADLQVERRAQILDAAQTCFARLGFHRATMQDVAKEAGMSPGNIYRYFQNKNALVAGLAERDQVRIAEDFAQTGREPNFLAAFGALARKYFIDEPHNCSVMALEIWAESTRNPEIAALSQGVVGQVRSGMTAVFETARERGAVPATLDIDRAVRFVLALGDGLMKRRAIDADFVGEREVETMIAVVGAVLEGRVPLTPPKVCKEGISA